MLFLSGGNILCCSILIRNQHECCIYQMLEFWIFVSLANEGLTGGIDILTGYNIISSLEKYDGRFAFKHNALPDESWDYADYGIGKIVFDPEAFSVSVGTETFIAHDGQTVITVYQTDFIPKDPANARYQFRFQF